MAFPRSPSKAVSGKLKISVRPPTSVQIETQPATMIPPGTDDNVIRFTLPAGFGMDVDLDLLVERQVVASHKSLSEIEKRYAKCAPCRSKGYKPEMSAFIRQRVDEVGPAFKGKLSFTPNLTIGHEKNGDISFEIRYQDRTLLVISRSLHEPLIGKFERHKEVGSGPFVPEDFEKALAWVIGND